ncbi:MAG: hypothetical protein HKN80_00180, partial [Acidimicrobiia bacterium]|nr:hypothetical protein [Acidimicrobiia bacterium]
MKRQSRVFVLAAAAVLAGMVFGSSSAHAIWPRSLGGPLEDSAHDAVVDALGNTYITGEFAGTFFVDATELSSQGLSDIFVAKINSQGDVVWVATAGGSSVDRGEVITVDAAGRVYVAGLFSGSVEFANAFGASLELPACTSGAAGCDAPEDAFGEIFISQLTSDGEWVWVRQGGSVPPAFQADTQDRALALDIALGDSTTQPPAPDGVILGFGSPCPEFYS